MSKNIESRILIHIDTSCLGFLTRYGEPCVWGRSPKGVAPNRSIYIRGLFMWYFAWILGVLLACAFGIINVMWMETEEMLGSEKDS